jgi:putative pyruvate formate lyase activating enzyme
MIETAESKRGLLDTGRSHLARSRVTQARQLLSECCLCAHHCGVDRLAGERGLCGATEKTRCFSAQIEAGDELIVGPTFAIALSGCDLRCDFCITGRSSWDPRAGDAAEPHLLADAACKALQNGAASIMILGGEPAIHLPFVLSLIAELPDSAYLVWKTNAHNSKQIRPLLVGMFDLWLADLKFGNSLCANRLAGVGDYMDIVQDNLLWSYQHSDLVVRHLLLPGHVNCCWSRVARWLAAQMPGVKVSLRTEFWPAWFSRRHDEISGTIKAAESMRAFEIGRELELNFVE